MIFYWWMERKKHPSHNSPSDLKTEEKMYTMITHNEDTMTIHGFKGNTYIGEQFTLVDEYGVNYEVETIDIDIDNDITVEVIA